MTEQEAEHKENRASQLILQNTAQKQVSSQVKNYLSAFWSGLLTPRDSPSVRIS